MSKIVESVAMPMIDMVNLGGVAKLAKLADGVMFKIHHPLN